MKHLEAEYWFRHRLGRPPPGTVGQGIALDGSTSPERAPETPDINGTGRDNLAVADGQARRRRLTAGRWQRAPRGGGRLRPGPCPAVRGQGVGGRVRCRR